MYHFKKLIFLVLFLSFLFSTEKSFRGKNRDDILRSNIPISFMHQVTQGYDLLPQQLSPMRGGYLIIAREGLVQQGYIDVFAEFKKNSGL